MCWHVLCYVNVVCLMLCVWVCKTGKSISICKNYFVCVVCILFYNQWTHVGVGTGVRMMTDMSIFVRPLLLVLRACFCVTQSVRCWVKEILSNRASVLSCMQCLTLRQDLKK